MSNVNRRFQRIPTPQGVWVAWQHDARQNVSRVRDLNNGGLFINTPELLALGSAVTLLLSVPEGEIRSNAVVRNMVPGEGVGVEFTDMAQQDLERLERLITRLLPADSTATQK